MQLSELISGEKAQIGAFKCVGGLKERLLSMGVTQGEEFSVLSRSAKGATIEILLPSGRVALRKSEAKAIEVRKI